MKTYKIASWLPIFPGFYNTLYQPDEKMEIDSIQQERNTKNFNELPFDAFEFDYETYDTEISIAFTKAIEQILKELSFIESIEQPEIVSPKEYNFKNDSINCVYTLTNEQFKKIKAYIIKEKEIFQEYLKDRYTSCSGFISHYPNDFESWLEFLTLEKIQDDAHILGSLFEFIIRNETEKNEIDDFEINIYYDVTENVYLSCSNYEQATEREYCIECNEFLEKDVLECPECKKNELKSVSIYTTIDAELETPHASDHSFMDVIREKEYRERIKK